MGTAVCLPMPSFGTPTPGFTNGWETLSDPANWASVPPYQDANVGNPSYYLQLQFPEAQFPMPYEVRVGGSGAPYSGDFSQPGLTLSFRFLASSVLPDYTMVFLISDGTQWEHSFTPTTVGSWETWTVTFTAGEWYGIGDFASDIQDIDMIGIHVIDNSGVTDEQIYGIDDWEYSVPEPGSLCLLAAVFTPLGLMFRKRLVLPFHRAK